MKKLKQRSVEELDEILIERRTNNPHKYYTPNGKAEEFIRMVGEGKTFICFFSGGNGTSKTSTGVNIIAHLIYGLSGNSYFNYPLFENFPYPKRGRIISDPTTIQNIIVPELKKWLPKGRYNTFKKGKNYESWWKSDTGHGFDLMTYEQALSEFESATLGWAWFDEPPSQAIFKATVARMRRGGIIFITATPLTGSAWLYDHIVAYQQTGKSEQRDFVFADVEDNCFIKNTEYLTKNGWKLLEEAKKGDVAATVNLKTKKIEYQKVNGIIKKKYDGDVLHLYGDIKSTPEHRIVGKFDGKDNFEIRPAKNLYRGVRMLANIENGYKGKIILSPFPERFSIDDWAEFLGWYISEGCVSGVNGNPQIGKYQIYISQSKGEKREKIKRLIRKMKLPMHERKGDVWFSDKQIHQHLINLGNKYNKYIPSYIFEYPRQAQEIFYQSMVDGDGDGKNRYFTTSKRLADDFQQLLTIMGFRSSLAEQKQSKGGYGSKNKLYRIYRASEKQIYVNHKPQPIHYEGSVSCVSVPNGIIIVRANGKPLIVGNCVQHGVRGFLQHEHIEKMIAEYSEDEKQARVHGQFAHLIGLVFKTFNRKVHVIKPFTITKKDYIVVEALDPHPRNPDAVMWIAVNKNGDKIICNELYGNYKTGELAERIKSNSKEYRIEARICDPSAFVEDKHQSDPTGQTLARRLADLDLDYQPATKDRVAANRRIDDALYYEKSGDEMISAPEIYIFDTCNRIIWELEHWQWDDWRGKIAERKSPKETPQDKDDHQIENLGRLLLLEPEFIAPPVQTIYKPVGVRSEKDFDPFE